jgi:hypothetical protein
MNRGPPVTLPAEHARRRADLECRCIVSHSGSQSRRSARETPSDRSLRGESRRSDGKATTLRSSRADLAVFRRCHAFGTSMRRWGCAGRSYLSHSTSRSPATWWKRGAWRASRAHPTSSWHWSRIGMGLPSAQKVLAKSADSDGNRASRCSLVTSKHRAASAGLLATAGEPASCMFLMRCIRDARVPQAAAGMRLERRLRWHVHALPW